MIPSVLPANLSKSNPMSNWCLTQFKPGLLEDLYQSYFPQSSSPRKYTPMSTEFPPKVAIVQFARLQSYRIPNKMLEIVGGDTLFGRSCSYLLSLRDSRPGVIPIIIVPAADKALISIAESHGIRCLTMTVEQASHRLWPDLIKPFIPELSLYDWVWDANIACHPFLRLETGHAVIDCLQGNSPSNVEPQLDAIVFALQERNVLWDQMYCQVWPRGAYVLADTARNPPFLKPSHIAYCYRPSALDQDEETIASKLVAYSIHMTKEEQIDIDNYEDLQLARRLAVTDRAYYTLPKLQAIAFGTGPSFFRFVDDCLLDQYLTRFEGGPSLYGCGKVPLYINGLRYYGYGDVIHCDNVPDGRPSDPHHPGCITYAGTRNLGDGRSNGGYMPPLLPYADLDLPHGNSSGGMAISMACLHHDIVGIVGFDGDRASFGSDEAHENFVNDFRKLINYWTNRGRRIVSLMPSSRWRDTSGHWHEPSIFEPIIEPSIQPITLTDPKLGHVC